jgi:hypothetical protein
VHLHNGGKWDSFGCWYPDCNPNTINFTDRVGDRESAVVATDICGHEFTHLVTAYNSGLVYRRQPGAINEALSDVFGAFVEKNVFGRSASNFLVGEATGSPVRDMRHPHRTVATFGPLADNMGELYTVPPGEKLDPATNDTGYVHYNSSIVNNAWTLQVAGGTHDTTKVVVSHATGWDNSIKFWWKTQRQLLTRRSKIPRLARVQSVVAARSKGRYDVRAVGCSWAAVSALGSQWVEQNLRIRCDGLAPPEETSTESCDGTADGVYCSTNEQDLGYLCRNQVVTLVKCNDGLVCKGAYEGQMIVSCAAP